MSLEQAIQTRFLPADRELNEFRGPVCPEWEMWWRKIASKAKINKSGFLEMDNRIVGARYTGNLYGDASVFENEEYLGSGTVLVKNHERDNRLRSLIGVTNGLTVVEGYVFTVELSRNNDFVVLRAAQEADQALLGNFFNNCTL